jgi:hypothetical protein
MRRCAVTSCRSEAKEVVAHPGRDEDVTPLCGHHAEIATRDAGAEVVSE